jgi:Carboxypeptidase regulatory-like domain
LLYWSWWWESHGGFPAEEQGAPNGLVDIRGSVVTEEGNPVANLSIRCKNSQQGIVREVLTNAQGAFTLPRLPSHVGTIDCEAGNDRIYAKAQKQIPVIADTQVTFTLEFQMVEQVRGWITVPKGGGIENALVEITRNGATFSQRTAADSGVTFEKLKAGPATVRYSAEGVQSKEVPCVLIAQGSDLSASLPFDWSPLGLILLIPAIVVLMTRAGMEGFWRRCHKEHSCLASLILILITLALWGITFGWVWYALSDKTNYNLDYFHPELSFSLAVPVFGFLGPCSLSSMPSLKGSETRIPTWNLSCALPLVPMSPS